MFKYIPLYGCFDCPYLQSENTNRCTRLNDVVDFADDGVNMFDKRCPLRDLGELKDCIDCNDFDDTMGVCRLTDKYTDIPYGVPNFCPKIYGGR